MSQPTPKIQRVEVPESNTVVFVCNLTGTAVIGEQLEQSLSDSIRLVAKVVRQEKVRDPEDDDYTWFCKKFNLPDSRRTYLGYEKLCGQNSFCEADCSVRLTNCLESEGILTMLAGCLRPEAELLKVRNFGETTLKELKIKASEFSGLSLRW